jgi:murein DD-endopeptidase MepM/ murein hydrolase activator NlpD
VKTDDVITYVVIGGILYMLANNDNGPKWGTGWVYPVPPLRIGAVDYPAQVSNGFANPAHFGVDVMYKRRSIADRPEFPAGTEAGSTMFFAPPGTPVLAAKDARVWSVDRSPRGWEIVLDHGAPWATYYQHLSSVLLPLHANGRMVGGNVPVTVKAGQQIGTMGGDPLDNGGHHLRHLHFSAWYKGNGDGAAVDPERAMSSWQRAPVWVPA